MMTELFAISLVINIILLHLIYVGVQKSKRQADTILNYIVSNTHIDDIHWKLNTLEYGWGGSLFRGRRRGFWVGYRAFADGKPWTDAPIVVNNLTKHYRKITRLSRLEWLQGWRFARSEYRSKVVTFLNRIPINEKLIGDTVNQAVQRKMRDFKGMLNDIWHCADNIDSEFDCVKDYTKSILHQCTNMIDELDSDVVKRESFVELWLDGIVPLGAIDAFVDEWHNGDYDVALAAYLGLLDKEYEQYALGGEKRLDELKEDIRMRVKK